MKHQILAETNKGNPPNLRIARKTQELRRQGWPDNIGCQDMQEDGKPILDTGTTSFATSFAKGKINIAFFPYTDKKKSCSKYEQPTSLS